MKKISTVMNLITNFARLCLVENSKKFSTKQNAETLAAVHTHIHTSSFISKNNAIIAFINNVKKDEKF